MRDAVFWDVSSGFLRFHQRSDPLVIIEQFRGWVLFLLQEHQLRVEQEAAFFPASSPVAHLTDMLIASVVQTVLDNTLYRRLYPRLDQEQAEDQAEFRSTHQTTDHFASYRMIEQKCHERRIKMWTATIDFTKAFDSITRKSIWKALKSCGIEHDCISLLKKICRDQMASVLTDEESNMFEIKKGTNQGDPLSSLLLSTRFYRKHWKTTFRIANKKKGWEST